MKPTAFLLFALTILAQAEEKLYDDKLATNAVAIIRVEFAHHSSDPTWAPNYPLTSYIVWPKQIIKDEWGEFSTTATTRVCVIKGREGIPTGESTIYLERYSLSARALNKTNGVWVLVGGDATNGVSHVSTNISRLK